MNKRFLQRLGKKLKNLRNERGLTQDDLACDTGLSLSTISMVAVAKRDIIVSKLTQIAKALRKIITDSFKGKNQEKFNTANELFEDLGI